MTIQRNYMANIIKKEQFVSLITGSVDFSFKEGIITLLINI